MRQHDSGAQREAIKRYTERCLRRYDPGDSEIARRVSPGVRRTLERSVGVLAIKSPLGCTQRRNKCVGLRIGRHIVTARHCVAWEPTAFTGKFEIDDERIEITYDFETIGGDRYEARLDQRLVEEARDRQLDFHPTDFDRDWVVLEITSGSGPTNRGSIRLVPGTASAGQQTRKLVGKKFLFLSHQPYLRVAAEVASEQPLSEAALVREAMSFEYAPTCSVLHERKGMLLHQCHTEATMSGTPLLIMNGANIELVGIHTGAVKESELPGTPAACQATSLTGFQPATLERTFNQGIRLPSRLVRMIGQSR